MLSNFQIQDLCKANKIQLNGVFSKDELRLIDPREGNYVINLQSSTQGQGTHWLSLVIQKTQAFFFDPYGAPPPPAVTRFVRRKKVIKKFGYNSWIIQDLKSESCGWFGLALLLYLKNNPSNDLAAVCNRFVNQFSQDTKENEIVLSEQISKLKNTTVVETFLKRKKLNVK
jgi:hypothetical protein